VLADPATGGTAEREGEQVHLTRKIGLVLGPVVAAAGIGALALAAGGSAALASGQPVCTSAASCVTGDPVLASVNVPSSTEATLSGMAMSFGNVLPGNTGTGTETYQVGTNDDNGAQVTATWDDSEIVEQDTNGLVAPVPAGSSTDQGFSTVCQYLGNPTSPGVGGNYNLGMVDLNTIGCTPNGDSAGQAANYIPWSALSVVPAAGANGTPMTFAYDATGGVDPVNNNTSVISNNQSGAASDGGSNIATVANFDAPLPITSYTDTYSLAVPANQTAGIYAGDLWYQVISN
jgi:hypothetical protein